jgi:uncharacterized protein YacL (UPF0231 family)
MKKEYIMPRVYDMACEGEELMETSLNVYDTEITKDQMLSRESVWEDEE